MAISFVNRNEELGIILIKSFINYCGFQVERQGSKHFKIRSDFISTHLCVIFMCLFVVIVTEINTHACTHTHKHTRTVYYICNHKYTVQNWKKFQNDKVWILCERCAGFLSLATRNENVSLLMLARGKTLHKFTLYY